MARTIAEIKQEMTDAFMAESAVREKYGFTASDTFDSKFSKVSIEGLLFYVVAFGIWVMEKLFDSHKAEVETMLAERMPHTTRWYRDRVLAFHADDNGEGPVKYCSVDDRGARLKIKIACGEAGERKPLTDEEKAALESYLEQEKDAGMKIEVVNENRNRLQVGLKLWYDPLELVPTAKGVERAVKEYVSTLDFDGLLSRNGLSDAVRAVAGVEEVRIESLRTKYGTGAWEDFGQQRRAESGYWTVADADITVNYQRYERGNLQ